MSLNFDHCSSTQIRNCNSHSWEILPIDLPNKDHHQFYIGGEPKVKAATFQGNSFAQVAGHCAVVWIKQYSFGNTNCNYFPQSNNDPLCVPEARSCVIFELGDA